VGRLHGSRWYCHLFDLFDIEQCMAAASQRFAPRSESIWRMSNLAVLQQAMWVALAVVHVTAQRDWNSLYASSFWRPGFILPLCGHNPRGPAVGHVLPYTSTLGIRKTGLVSVPDMTIMTGAGEVRALGELKVP
jgi:hypothetical protein